MLDTIPTACCAKCRWCACLFTVSTTQGVCCRRHGSLMPVITDGSCQQFDPNIDLSLIINGKTVNPKFIGGPVNTSPVRGTSK
jgi:hypothetical protein